MITSTSTEGTKGITVHMPVSLHRRLFNAAHTTRESGSALIRRAIENEVERIEEQDRNTRNREAAK